MKKIPDKLKTVGICIALFVPSLLLSGGVAYILAVSDYGPDPSNDIGIMIWGFWSLSCGVYLKSNKFKIAGGALLVFSIFGLFTNA